MANSFDFELTASDQASAAIMRIEDVVKNLNPLLDKTRDSLELGGQDSRDNLDDLNKRFDVLSRNAREGVQFISDLVPPLKMVGGLTLGLGGAATLVNVVKNNLVDFANSGYRIDTIAKNVSMTADAFQELTGAMIENGSAREDAEGSIADLFDKATAAAYGENPAFLAVLNAKGIGISKTKEGLADVGKLVQDINEAMQNMSSGEQALFIKKLSLSPDMLSLLRNTTIEVQRLKDQARRDGLIFSDKDLQNALAFRTQLNQIGALWDGLKLKMQSRLGSGGENTQAINASVESYKLHNQDSESSFYHGDQQQDILHRARRDESFKRGLTFFEGIQLALGRPGESLQNKLNDKYLASWSEQKQRSELERLHVHESKSATNPLDRAFGNTPEQHRLSQLEVQHNLPSGLLDKVWNTESARGKRLYSPAGAEGPFQFMPPTGRDYGLNSREDRMDFNKSSEAAARYLKVLLGKFDGDVKKAVAAYNWGPDRVEKLGLGRAPRETRDYLNKIMPGLPEIYPQGGDEGADKSPSLSGNPPSLYGRGEAQGYINGEEANQKLVAALKDLNQTMQDSKMKLELTLVDQKTGERKTFTGQNGGRVSETYELQ